jgi:hypothetical protein
MDKIVSMWDVYIAFRKAQASFNNRGYRLPKDFDTFIEHPKRKKMKECLETASKFFCTKWSTIDIDRYMKYGFELFGKNFTYIKFFNRKVLDLYIEKDKNLKRAYKVSKKDFLRSAKFVKGYFLKNGYSKEVPILVQYCRMKEEGLRKPVFHYLKGYIDNYFMVWLINKGYLKLSDQERALMPYVTSNFYNYVNDIDNIKNFITKVEGVLKW